MNTMDTISALLTQFDLHPVLVDVGASGDPPDAWAPLSNHAVYIGFDPDEREMTDAAEGQFARTIIINKALTPDPEQAHIRFFLTRSPYCSSTLEPNQHMLANYIFQDLFTVEREAEVSATTLDTVLDQLALSHADWIKLDTQGLDLRLLKSLSEQRFDQLLGVDIEPGLLPFYRGEDQFADLHSYLVGRGFWPVHMNVKGVARVQPSTLDALPLTSEERRQIEQRLQVVPGWVEARYLRDPASLSTREQLLLLWIFALMNAQYGFAFDLVQKWLERYADEPIAVQLQSLTHQQLMQSPPLKKRIAALVRRWWRRI